VKTWLVKFLSTLGFIGYSPFAPGTAGTLFSIIPYFFLSYLNPIHYTLSVILIIILSIIVSSFSIEIFESEDPKQVVADELCGFLVTMFLVSPSLLNILLGFVIFRLFDIIKPLPIRRIEQLPGGFGIVLDDVAAGIYSCIVIHIILSFI